MASASAQREQPSRAAPPRPPPPNTEERNSFSYYQKVYNKAHTHVSNALSLDEGGRETEAREEYLQGLHLVDVALTMDCRNLTPEEQDLSTQMQQKLTKTRLQIEYRLQAIDRELSAAAAYPDLEERTRMDAPPSYDEAVFSGVSTPTSPTEETMMELGDSIMNGENQNGVQDLQTNADRIFEINDGIQIFFITPEGYVSAPSYPSSLSVFKFKEEACTSEQYPPSFLQVNDWVYPLIPGTSPALRTSYGAYMFPDTASDVPGAAVGLMLPDTMNADERLKFEQLLRSLTVMEEQSAPTPEGATAIPAAQSVYPQIPPEQTAIGYPQIPSAPHEQSLGELSERGESEALREGEEKTTSAKISKGILVAADWISWGVGKGAEKASEWIKYGSDKLQGQLQPQENPRPIDKKVQKGAMYARKATNVAVKVSSFVVGKLSDATAALGRQMAPHIRKQGEKIMPKVFKKSEDGSSKFDGVLEVAASGLKGFGTVYLGLEASAKALAKNIANETVHVVNHKYGEEAGKLTENTLYSVGNLAMTTHNANNLGVKAIAKRAAKDTGKAVLSDLQETRMQKKNTTHQNVENQNGEKAHNASSEKNM